MDAGERSAWLTCESQRTPITNCRPSPAWLTYNWSWTEPLPPQSTARAPHLSTPHPLIHERHSDYNSFLKLPPSRSLSHSDCTLPLAIFSPHLPSLALLLHLSTW